MGTIVLIILFLVLSAPRARAANPEPVFTGLSFPASLAFAPDGRIFYTEKNTGNIRVIQNTRVLPGVFTTLQVSTDSQEQGLLGIALDPGFSTNGFVYAYRTYYNGSYYHGQITRFTAVVNTGNNPTSIFDTTNPSRNLYHNGGYLKFGPDGKLYVQTGEFQVEQLAQDLSSYAGKILRMNPDGSVPSDNPFPGSLVYAYGIRNGFGMDFSAGLLIETEPGTRGIDEINLIIAGGNYGWPNCLGKCGNSAYRDPIVTFSPEATPTGITHSSSDTFYFGEWSVGDLKRLRLNPDHTVASIDQVFSLGTSDNGIVAVETGPDGDIYFSTSNAIYAYHPGSPVSSSPWPGTFWLVAIGAGSVLGATVILLLVRRDVLRRWKTDRTVMI